MRRHTPSLGLKKAPRGCQTQHLHYQPDPPWWIFSNLIDSFHLKSRETQSTKSYRKNNFQLHYLGFKSAKVTSFSFTTCKEKLEKKLTCFILIHPNSETFPPSQIHWFFLTIASGKFSYLTSRSSRCRSKFKTSAARSGVSRAITRILDVIHPFKSMLIPKHHKKNAKFDAQSMEFGRSSRYVIIINKNYDSESFLWQ